MKNTKLFWGSSYDRGLEHLLNMWEDIKKQVPDATLDICYGWDTFLGFYSNNAERMNWKKYMDDLMAQDGITHHGRLGKQDLARVRASCGIWAYPTHFPEIFCITAIDCQRDGLVPVVINYAALKETVGAGAKIGGNILDFETKEEFKKELIKYMKDEKLWKEESKKALKFSKGFDWEFIAKEWEKHL